MDHPTRVAATCVAAFLLASALYWLAIERRPEGVPGMLLDALAPIYLFPSLLSGGLGGNIHSMFDGFFFFGLFAEAYLAVFVVVWMIILVSRRRSSR
jgi:hypothetical protein